MENWKIDNTSFKKKIFKKINHLYKLKKYNEVIFEIKKILFFSLDEHEKNSLKKILKSDYSLFLKNNSLRKIKILFLSNHYLENFRFDLLLCGIEKNLFLDVKFGGVNQLNYNELPKNIKNQLHEFDLIIYSNFINYDYNLDIKKNINQFKKNIASIKKINPKIMVSDNPKISEVFTNYNLIDKYNSFLNEFCKKNHFSLWETNLLQGKIGFRQLHDTKYFFDNKIFFNPKFSGLIFNDLASYLSFQFQSNIRLIITDLDNTMWRGLAADDKKEEINFLPGDSLGQPHYNYQLFLKELNKKNILIAAASKNDNNLIKKIFKKKKLPFEFTNFVETKINWNPKSENIKEICKKTNLSPENVLFIDDSKSEIFEVLENVPKINVLSFDSPLNISQNIERSNYFKKFSNEKINRLKSIKSSENLSLVKNNSSEYKKYLKNLKMKMQVTKVNQSNMSRFVELINKTNQFNLNLKRTSSFEVKKFLKNKNNIGLTFQLKDKFIDHGIISNLMVSVDIKKKEAKIDAFVISCRVFERRVEYYIIDKLINLLKKRKIKILNSLYIKTDRNTQFQNYYKDVGFKIIKNLHNKKYFELTLNNFKKNEFYIK